MTVVSETLTIIIRADKIFDGNQSWYYKQQEFVVKANILILSNMSNVISNILPEMAPEQELTPFVRTFEQF